MSRLFEALRQSELERAGQSSLTPDSPDLAKELLRAVESEPLSLEPIRTLRPAARPHSRLVALTDMHSLGAEKFRLLGTRLKHLQEQHKIKKILVTSSVMDEGKSVVTANLALTLAQAKQKTLLLEGDLRQPVLNALFGFAQLPGLSEWGRREEPVTKFLYRLEGLPLWYLPAGAHVEQPLELLESQRLANLLNQFTGWFDWVLVDCTPLLPLADASIWSRLTDGILLVARQGKTPKSLLQKALETLDKPRILGVVFNEAVGRQQRYYGRYYANLGSGKKSSNNSKKPVQS